MARWSYVEAQAVSVCVKAACLAVIELGAPLLDNRENNTMISAPFPAIAAQQIMAAFAALSICVSGLTLMFGFRKLAARVFLMGIFLAFAAALAPNIFR